MSNDEMHLRKRRKQRRKKIKLYRNLLFFILILVIIIYFMFSDNKSHENKFDYTLSKIFNEKLKSYNKSLFYKKYDFKDGSYIFNDNYRLSIENKLNNNYESYLYEKLKEYLEENKISEDKLSLYILKGNSELLRINDEIKSDKIDIIPLIKLIVIRNSIDNKIIKDEDIMILDKSDLSDGSKIYNNSNVGQKLKIDRIINEAYINNDNAAKNLLDRYLSYKGISIIENLGEYFKNHDLENFSVKDIVKILELYDNKSNTLNSVFEYYLREKNDLFIKFIYSSLGNKNEIKKGEISYDYGIVNSNNKYYYAIYFENIDDKHINNIGDIINRTIEEVENLRNIQTR